MTRSRTATANSLAAYGLPLLRMNHLRKKQEEHTKSTQKTVVVSYTAPQRFMAQSILWGSSFCGVYVNSCIWDLNSLEFQHITQTLILLKPLYPEGKSLHRHHREVIFLGYLTPKIGRWLVLCCYTINI